MKRIISTVMPCGFFLHATSALAWQNNDRDQTWEAMFEIRYQGSDDVTTDSGSYMDINADLGWGFGFAYNPSAHLNIGINFSYVNADYKALVNTADAPGSSSQVIRHDADHYSYQINATYHLLAGDFTPLLQAGFGSSEIDSNVSNGDGYWYCNPYYYYCTSYNDTYDASGFAYNLGAGLRWDFGNNAFFKAVYMRQYLDLDTDANNPQFDIVSLQLGGKF